MSKLAKHQHQSDSDLSLQLSDASSLSSDSDLRVQVNHKKQNKKKPHKKKPKKGKTKKKTDPQYCVCRRGYDGKEFMIECDQCKEWFHGACVGLKPNSVTDHYFCKSCTTLHRRNSATNVRKKSIIILPVIAKSQSAEPSTVQLPSTTTIDENEEDEEDDLCILCDGDCTCGAVTDKPISLPPTPPPPAARKSSQKKMSTKIIIPAPRKPGKMIPKKSNTWTVKDRHHSTTSDESSSSISSDSESGISDFEHVQVKPTPRRGKSKTLLTNIMGQKSSKKKLLKKESEEDSDEELIVDDLDDLLETMSPLSASSSMSESEEFFTDEEDEQPKELETCSSLTGSSVHIDSGDDEDIEEAETQAIIDEMGQSEEDEGSGMFVEGYTEDECEEYDEEEEEEAIPYHSHWSSSEDDEEEEEFDMAIVLPTDDDETLLDSEGNLYDSITAAFMQAMASQQVSNTTGANTPIMGAEYHALSAFELTSALNSVIHHHQYDGISRRPSLPSNTVSAAHRHRGSHDLSTSEALSTLVLDNLSLAALEPIQEQEKEEMEEMEEKDKPAEDKQDNICNIDRLSPNQYLEALTTSIMLEQQQKQQEGKRKMDMLTTEQDNDKKKLRIEESYPSSAPASPAAIIDELEDMIHKEQKEEEQLVTMDDLVDTSRLDDHHSPSLEQDELFSRDLSRWQRIPIGAFRLMRSKNRLWLER
ncbi:hypothetical protein A0J61_02469 [Choanephora cucurbitarum]|uniref:PHD-type domain-containing protein n=1 Tax=Choanephora cucurbitarum TaxID=101091 RepID=A0A1C7NJZ3_9FUNG|nr:hypothetical protein A0J61_02469 [Choanephora cucurbitarum]